ncbi:DUF4923 family protein [uncultured Alistipes sp.]|uniref:DUF4923 family protein n=1 Tax=uncultured Alistipes sp. TaxID=538949 RepID=UPI00261DE184|nr:DUF4923 family protein [uncultured Alistipes sp.]
MKRFFVLMLAGLLCSSAASAQGWLDAMKRVATDAIDQATGGKLTEKAIVGTWNYSAPGVKMNSSDMLANVGGTVMESTVSEKLKGIYEKVGIVPGACTITFADDDTFSMPVKGRAVTGTYEFDPSTHAITLHVGKLKTAVTGYAYISGGNLQLVFPVDKLVSFVTAVGSKISSLSSLSTLLQKYDDVNLGFEFSK